jgi:hypothetical protein
MLRWFADFEHLMFYVEIKLFVLSVLLVMMWMQIEQPFQFAAPYN